MIQDRNIICIASNWFYDPTSKHHLMKLLSRHNHVIWVNYHASRKPQWSARDAGAMVGKIRQIIQGPRQVAESITVVTPLVVPLPGNRAVASLNAELLVRQIRSVLNDLPERPTQLWSFAPDVDYLCGRFDEELRLYYCVDEFSRFVGYDAEQVLAAERRLAERADLLIVTSQALLEAKRSLHSRVALVSHGVDAEHFRTALRSTGPIPLEIRELPRPVLGFWGLIQDWVDLDLLEAVARRRPQWSIVLIGEAAADVGRLHRFPNVRLLGRRHYQKLPEYARGMDIGIIPFRVNDLTRAVNPIKLREYLSAGLPVVSTPLPEVASYDRMVRVADTPETFVEACEAAVLEAKADVAGRARRARHEAMLQETWEAKLAVIEQHVQAALAARSPRAAAIAVG